jgi:hypothetical protein
VQLNKDEALHGLRAFLYFANGGTIRRKQEDEQTNQASCLNLLANAVMAWNTVYMAPVTLLAIRGSDVCKLLQVVVRLRRTGERFSVRSHSPFRMNYQCSVSTNRLVGAEAPQTPGMACLLPRRTV